MTGLRRAAVLVLAGLCAGGGAPRAAEPDPAPVRIAVFAFELVDATPSQMLLGKSTSESATLAKVSQAAREQLAQSGRYRVIDASQAADRRLSDCDGCEAALARKLGADQSLLGVVKRVTQTDYYVLIQIRDAHTGKLLDEQDANFAGSEDGWASGVRMLIRHQILAPPPR
jgi:Tol biopolymer transport system component